MYDKLLQEAAENGLTVIERYPFTSPRIRGLCCDDTIAISDQIDTRAERTVVLCEELTHATHSFGNILNDAHAERRVRERIFDRLVGREGLVRAYLAGCREAWEFAERLGVPEAFFTAAMQNYKERYGTRTEVDVGEKRFVLAFEPTMRVRRRAATGKEERI